LSKNAPALTYAFDNVSGGAGGIDISNGFSGPEKYAALSNNRLNAGVSGSGEDIMHVVSTGPFTINAGDSTTVGFAILAGDDLTDLQASAVNAQLKWDSVVAVVTQTTTSGTSIGESSKTFSSVSLYPNPTSGQAVLSFTLYEKSVAEISLYNLVGQEIKKLNPGNLGPGKYQFNLDVNDFPAGIYYYQLKAGKDTFINRMIISK
jgi:serine protease